MADGKTSASVVVVDAHEAARLRNESARRELSDCVEKPLELHVLTGVQYTVPYTLKVAGEAKEAALAKEIMLKCTAECDQHLNVYNPQSEISKFNSLKEGVAHNMSDHLLTVLQATVRVNGSSGNVFDPCSAAIAQKLKEYMQTHVAPPPRFFLDQLIQATNTYASIRSLRIDFKAKTLMKTDARTTLDLGGINKGYTIDRVIDGLKAIGIRNAFFEWGGDVKVIGHNHRREQWRVGLVCPPSVSELSEKPRLDHSSETTKYLKVIHLDDDEAVCTSGDYENLWKVAGSLSGGIVTEAPAPGQALTQGGTTLMASTDLKSTHFHPRHLRFVTPSDRSIAQVSVKSSSCMIADALATAAMLKPDFASIRGFLERWRYVKFSVLDFTAFVREEQLLSHMHHVDKESEKLRKDRIAACLPARVVVVGGGLAGLSATIEAARCGASVVLIEKASRLGGNSAKATSGINGWGTVSQSEKDIMDGGKFFERDTYVSGVGGHCDTGMVQTLSEQSRAAIHWLMKDFKLPLTVVSQLGGHSRPRTHRAPDKPDGTPVPIGYTIMKHLTDHVQTELKGRVTVMTETAVVRLIHNPAENVDQRARVGGVVYKSKDGTEVELLADSVVLTTGGFANDHTEHSLLSEFTPHLAGMPTTNGAFATGDGMKMARSIGAMLLDMDKVQLHPTGLIDPNDPNNRTKYLGPEAIRGSGGILLNQHGKRFVNELDLRSVVSKAINDQGFEYPGSDGCKVAYCILNPTAVKLFGPNSLAFYRDRLKLFTELPTVTALAEFIKAPVDVVQETLEAYYHISSTKLGRCPQTNKSVFPCALGPDGPFTVAVVTPSIHYTMGGVGTTPSAEVFDSLESVGIGTKHRRTILGLFAAGEVTGGLHGNNRLGGNSLLECVVFGRIAGDRAATILQKNPSALSTQGWCPVVLREYREGIAYGQGSRLLRFNLPGSAQRSGLLLGQFVGIKGDWDGRQLLGYYSPVSLPHEPGVVSILCRVDKGSLKDWIGSLKPGDTVYMKACGGLAIQRDVSKKAFFLGDTQVERIGLIAGGTGVAPMLQIIRAALKHPFTETIQSLSLVYAAEEISELTYKDILLNFQKTSTRPFHAHFVLNYPPPGWTEGVGFIDEAVLSGHLPPPAPNVLIVMCGPPVMQRAVVRILHGLGYQPNMVHTVDEDASQHKAAL